jgi:DNA (cytosine-5)-methyltransferase 1
MKLLDLFCCAGGAAMGYHRAGFDVAGVDIKPQPRYPFAFVQADAVEYLRTLIHTGEINQYAAIHASPPCQRYTLARNIRCNDHPDLVAPIRELCNQSGLPYVIENVRGAPLINAVMLRGEMFGLMTRRPRLFECSFDVPLVLSPQVAMKNAKMGRQPKAGEMIQVVGNFTNMSAARDAMGIDWMIRDELREAIPPAYTQFIGGYLAEEVQKRCQVK